MIKCVSALIIFLVMLASANAQIVFTEDTDSSATNTEQTVQQNDTTPHPNSDVIHRHDGTKMYADVKKIYLNDIYYSLPGQTKVNKMDQRYVHKVEYKSGKIEVLNETASTIRETNDYRKVKVTESAIDIDGLIEVAKLEARVEGSERGYSTPKTLERSATIVLRKKAASVNADIVLITDKKVSVAFGEVPSLVLYGTAYSYR